MRNLVYTSLFALALALSAAPAAHAGEKHSHHHHRGGVERSGTEDRKVISVRLNQPVRDEAIPLRSLLDLDRRFRGYKLEKVVVHLKRRRSTERLALIADGEVIDSRRARRDPHIVLRPQSREVLGVTLRRLQLVVDGAAFIKSIDVQLGAPRRVHDHRQAQVWNHRATREELARLIGAEIVRVLAAGAHRDRRSSQAWRRRR